ncbi:MAG: hypothetical protein ACFCUQ_03620 [Kiloniellales bacterium]
MSEATIQRAAGPIAVGDWLGRSLALLVALALLLKLHLLFVLNVNWDEFHYLSKVYSYLRGELTRPLQTVHVHFFTWLRHVSENEVDQVIAARLVIYGFSLGSAWLFYRIGRCFLDSTATLFALLCYFALSYVVEHGTSFRFDPIAVFFCLGAVCLLLCARPAWLGALVAGLALAAALMVTIKSVLYLPVLGCLLLLPVLRSEDRRRGLVNAALFALALAGGFALLYAAHRASLQPVELHRSADFAVRAADKVFRLDDLFPRWPFFVVSLIESGVVWICLVLGIVTLVRRARAAVPEDCATAIPLLIFLLPLISLLIYRNAFPYFYVFIMPLPLLACGAFFAAIVRSSPGRVIRSPRLLAAGLVLAVTVSLGKVYLASAEPALAQQRQTIALAHRLFPEPVAYIGRTEMVASYRKVGFFMSTWGMENYLERGEPIFRELLVRERPLFLIANIASLDPRMPPERLRALGGYALLDEDHAVLAANYVHHWGALYVAGKRLALPREGDALSFEILIPGVYTLEAKAPVTIDGRLVEPGKSLRLDPGLHRAEIDANGPAKAILRWGEGLHRPAEPAPEGPLFTGF